MIISKITITSQNYYYGDNMEESVHLLTLKIIQQKKVMTTRHSRDIVGTFCVKLQVQNFENVFFYNMLDDENFKKQ